MIAYWVKKVACNKNLSVFLTKTEPETSLVVRFTHFLLPKLTTFFNFFENALERQTPKLRATEKNEVLGN